MTSNQSLIEDLVAALDAKQLQKIPKITKCEFAKRIVAKLPGRRHKPKDTSEYKANIMRSALAASEALQTYYDSRYQPASNVHIAAIQGLLISNDINQVALGDTIKHLKKISTFFAKQKPGKDNTDARLILYMAAKNYEKILGVKPSHNRNFQTYAYDKKTWDTSEKGNPTPFDMICFILHRATNVAFSEPAIREIIDLINQVDPKKKGKLRPKKAT